MLDVGAQNLIWEIHAAERFRNNHLITPRRLQERYAGHEFSSDRVGSTALENHSFEFLSLVIPRIIFENPKIRVSSRRPDLMVRPDLGMTLGDVAQLVQLEVNQWTVETDLRKTLLAGAYDASFSNATFLTTAVPEPAMDPSDAFGHVQPRVYRISPEQFGYDPRVASFDQARFSFHHWRRDKDDLERDAMASPADYILANVRATAINEGSNPSFAQVQGQMSRDRMILGPQRREVRAYDTWVPEIQDRRAREAGGPNAGFHGSIFTLSDTPAGGAYLRNPRPFWGPPWGPYSHGGMFLVPEDPYALSPLVATDRQARENDAVARALSWGTQKYRRIVFVDASNPAMIQQIQSAPDLWVVPVQGLGSDQVVTVEVGGITTQQITQASVMRDRLDRNSGIDEARRGRPTGVSATEADIAAQAGESRLVFMQRQFQSIVRQMLRSVAWYISQPLLQPVGALFHLLDFEVEPLSMSRQSEPAMQQRALLLLQLQQSIAQGMVTMPHTDWLAAARSIAIAFDEPDFERRFSLTTATQLTELALQAQQQQGQQGQGGARGGGGGATSIQSPRRGRGGSPGRPSKPAGAGRGERAGAMAAARQGVQTGGGSLN